LFGLNVNEKLASLAGFTAIDDAVGGLLFWPTLYVDGFRAFFCCFRLHRMYEMQSIVTDVRGVCLAARIKMLFVVT